MLTENRDFNKKEELNNKIQFLRTQNFTKEHSKHPLKKRWGGNWC
jgi:hypothetical protein